MMIKIQKSTFQFLKALKLNNNRIWFSENRALYDASLINVHEVFSEVRENLERHDEIEKQKIYRIYRDVRFSNDKTPYNPRFATNFTRLGKERRGGYYLEIKPGGSVLGGGFWKPEKEDLYRLRKEWEMDDSEIRTILSDQNFIQIFGGKLLGEELKTAPKGFDKNHPAIDLIRKKSFVALKSFTDEQVLSVHFIDEVTEAFKALRPFFDYMSDVLTTDLNGESLI